MVCDNDFTFLFRIAQFCNPCKFRNNCKAFRLSGFKNFLDTGKALCDIVTSNTPCVEGTHSKLCARFANRLGCNDAYGFTYLYSLASRHVCTIAFCTNPDMGAAG